VAILDRLIVKNANTSKRYIEMDDMDSKIKKGFEVVLSIAEHKKITVTAIEKIREFIELYRDVITHYDTKNKQIYSSRLKESLQKGMNTIETMSEVNAKMKVLGT